MITLGINAWHGDASACILVDGKLVCAVEEERLNRLKHVAGFPALAAGLCLERAGARLEDVDHVAVGRNPSANLLKKVLFTLKKRPSFAGLVKDRLRHVAKIRDVKGELCRRLDVDPERVGARFHNVEHHQAHIASAYFASGFDQAACLTVDGFGDFASCMLARAEGNRIEVLERSLFPHSLGLFYLAVTQFLGFQRYGDEGKVMGLSSYGETPYLDAMEKMVRIVPDGLFEMGLDYFIHHSEGVEMTWDEGSPKLGPVFSDRLVELLGEPRHPGAPIEKRHEDVAASLQRHLEHCVLHLARRLHAEVPSKNLAMAGGVALNCVANARIPRETGFEDLYIQPAAGDGGTSLGAALYVEHAVLDRPRGFRLEAPYTGPEYTEAECEAALREAGLRWRKVRDAPAEAARMVAGGKVLGWFQGKVEFGPRALGNRSILADPRRPDMKDILNSRIKHREPFRPFAPSVLEEHTGEVFEESAPSPFMLLAYDFRPEWREKVPAVAHVDGTGRLQTVSRDTAPRYWELIEAFRKETGVPLVLNTSFNENEPIVCTPGDAVRCFVETKMDALVLGDLVVEQG